tara:strand:+ start:1253 stop:1642 length:390 start_codon:yes stop_codon:yes gene_type:complete
MSIETMSQQIIALTEQVGKLEAFVYMASQEYNSNETTPDETNKQKKLKKQKKQKSDTDHDKPKKVSGYILFSKANRENAIEALQGSGESDVKIKSTDVMKELGKMWKDLPEPQKEEWNTKAKATMGSHE